MQQSGSLIMFQTLVGFSAPKAARRLVVLLAFLPLSATAQDRLDPVVVTGTREPQPSSGAVSDIVRIDADTIRDSHADSVEDLLRREAGLQITRNGGPGQSSGYLIRGSSASGTVVFIDGVRVGSATLGQAELESLSLAQIDHIEVRRGPASSLFGADAVGGVIQIFTRRGEGGANVTAHAAIGRYESRVADLGVSGSHGAFDYAATLGREQSQAVSALRPTDTSGQFNPDTDGFARNFANVALGYTPAAGHRIGVELLATRLDSHYDGADFNPPDFLPDPSADFRNRLKTTLATIHYRGDVSSLWTTTLQASRNVDDLVSGGATMARFKTTREQATWQNALHFAPGQQLVVAYEYLHESADADAFVGRPRRHNNALVAGYSGRFGAGDLEASLRRDDNSAYGGDTTGSIGYSHEVLPGLRLRALAGTTFRGPTFNDLYFQGFGVSTIKPERGRSFEVGAVWQSGDTNLSAVAYRNKVKDLIGFQPDRSLCPVDPAYDFGCAGNTSRARLQGATIGAGQRWGGLDLRAAVDFLDATDIDTGVRLTRRAAHQETLRADYERGDWTVGASLLDVGRRPDSGAILGGYGVVDLRTTWRFTPKWRLEAKLLNALDHRIEPTRDYQGLGRQAWLGVRYDGRGL